MSTNRSDSEAVRWAWLAIAVLAIASRLIGLGSTPLAPDEAARAVAAWDAARGGAWPAASESPLLLTGQVLLFTIFHPTAWLARLVPALAGTALVCLPFLWRRKLGELGALAAAGFLLVSPLSLFASHRADGAAVGVLGSGLILTALLTKGERRDGWLAAGLALGLTGGPVFYDVLFAGGLTWFMLWRIRRTVPIRMTPHWERAPATGLGIALLISVAGGLHWSGWAGILDGAASWVREWQITPNRSFSQAGLLLLYEPALLALVLTGLGLLAVRRDPGLSHRDKPWAVALLGGLIALLVALRPGSSSAGASVIVLPLALLGGWAVDHLWGGLAVPERRWMGLHALVVASFWAPALLALAQNARGLIGMDQIVLVLLGLLVLVALQMLLVFIFLMRLPLGLIWRSALTGSAALVLFIQMGFGVGLAWVRSDQAIEPAIHTAGSRNLTHLTEMLRRLAVEQQERQDSLPIALLDGDGGLTPTLRWALRDFGNVTVTAAWPQETDVLVVAPEDAAPSDTAVAGTWQGMRFVATTTYPAPLPRCRVIPLACSEALRWYFYRESSVAPTAQNVILWRATGGDN